MLLTSALFPKRECRIRFKTAGFTGARCGYTVVPKALERDGESLNAMWNRRQCTKFNGASYIIQRGAAAIYTDEGEKQIEKTLDYYRANARVIKEGLERVGFKVYGAVNSPYVWCKAPEGMGSWDLRLELDSGLPVKGTFVFRHLVTLMQPKKEFVASKSCSPDYRYNDEGSANFCLAEPFVLRKGFLFSRCPLAKHAFR